jgi:hypothetical protein
MNESIHAQRQRSPKHLLSVFGLVCSLAAPGSFAHAAPARQKAKASVSAGTVPKVSGKKARAKAPAGRADAPAVAPREVPAVPAAEAAAKPGGASARPDGAVVKTEELRDGEKTYTFGAQEVEGRLKSPQILYFLRRVRAEFDPAPLGHRSFLLELSDTRRHRAFE